MEQTIQIFFNRYKVRGILCSMVSLILGISTIFLTTILLALNLESPGTNFLIFFILIFGFIFFSYQAIVLFASYYTKTLDWEDAESLFNQIGKIPIKLISIKNSFSISGGVLKDRYLVSVKVHKIEINIDRVPRINKDQIEKSADNKIKMFIMWFRYGPKKDENCNAELVTEQA